MTKWMIGLAVVAACGVAMAADLNPDSGRAQALGRDGFYPQNLHLKTLWGRGDACPSIWWVSSNDGHCWNYRDPNPITNPYLYQVFQLKKPSGYDSGTLRWRIWGNSGLTVKIWRWKNSTQEWKWIDYYHGINIPLQTYESIPASWFNVYHDGKYYLYIMATVREGPLAYNIIADICDIQY